MKKRKSKTNPVLREKVRDRLGEFRPAKQERGEWW